MYTIIGGDGREYGPVSAEQIRQWIAAGRANGQTRAKVFGTEEWKQLQDFSDFNPSARADGIEPSESAFGSSPASAGYAPDPAAFDPIECFSRSWLLLRQNFWMCVGMPIAMLALSQGANAIFRLVFPTFVPDPDHPLEIFRAPMFWLSLWVPLLISQPLSAGLAYFFLKKARGEQAQFNDLFAGFSRAWLPLVLGSLVSITLIVLGTMFLILPGIYLAVAYAFVNLVIIDQRCGFWEGMEISRRAITKRWWAFLLFVIIGVMMLVIGFCALVIGFFVALPLLYGAVAYAYLDLVPGSRGTRNQVVHGELPRPEGEQDQPGE